MSFLPQKHPKYALNTQKNTHFSLFFCRFLTKMIAFNPKKHPILLGLCVLLYQQISTMQISSPIERGKGGASPCKLFFYRKPPACGKRAKRI